jgi:outer membrane protein TolC
MRWLAFPDRITSFHNHSYTIAQVKKMKLHARVVLVAAWVVALPLIVLAQDTSSGKEKPLAFRTAIELALKNSAATGLSQADLQRARSVVRETKNVFLPQMVLGSGLGASYGFPLSLEGAAPSVFNVNFQGALFNMAQRNYIKAARSDLQVTAAQNADRRRDHGDGHGLRAA